VSLFKITAFIAQSSGGSESSDPALHPRLPHRHQRRLTVAICSLDKVGKEIPAAFTATKQSSCEQCWITAFTAITAASGPNNDHGRCVVPVRTAGIEA
jgi:hypothetical protein